MKRLALLAAIAATALVCAAAPSSARTVAPAKKCLRHGQMCQVAHKSQYLRYGFKCIGGKLRDR